MRFDFDAYEKVFPEEHTDAQAVESAVDTFKPTESEKPTDSKAGDEMLKATPTADDKTEAQIVTTEEVPAEVPKGDSNE